MNELLPWITGIGVPLLIAAATIWWRVVHVQDKKIDHMHKANEDAHSRLHTKIDDLRKEILDLWKNRRKD